MRERERDLRRKRGLVARRYHERKSNTQTAN